MRARREVFLTALCGLLVACSSVSSASLESQDSTVEGVGKLPGAGPEAVALDETTGTTPEASTTTTTIVPAVSIGSLVAGNRLLMIGDSITASAAKRYGNEFCETLVPLGWQVEVDAEPSRFIDFGNAVLDQRLSAKWDAAYVFLGTNYGGHRDIYQKLLEQIVQRLAPTPVVLLTVTEFAENRRDVNAAILEVAAANPNVHVLDWGAIAAADAGTILRGDGHHLTNAGRAKLASSVAGVLGQAPLQPGDCLDTQFTADRGLDVNGSDAPPEKPVGGTPTPTTVKATTATTKPSNTTTPPPTQAPPQTEPPATPPPTTAGPPITRPPRTVPVPTTVAPTVTTPPPVGGP